MSWGDGSCLLRCPQGLLPIPKPDGRFPRVMGEPVTKPGGGRVASGPIRPRESSSPPGLGTRRGDEKRQISEEGVPRQGQGQEAQSEKCAVGKHHHTEWSREGQWSRLATAHAPTPPHPTPHLWLTWDCKGNQSVRTPHWVRGEASAVPAERPVVATEGLQVQAGFPPSLRQLPKWKKGVQRGHWSDPTLCNCLSPARTAGPLQSYRPPLSALERVKVGWKQLILFDPEMQ